MLEQRKHYKKNEIESEESFQISSSNNDEKISSESEKRQFKHETPHFKESKNAKPELNE